MSPHLPVGLTLNAFTGEDVEVSGTLAPQANKWGSRGAMLRKLAPLAPGDPVNLADWTLEIYVADDGTGAGTEFPSGMLTVWNVTEDTRPWALVSDSQYGR